MTMLERTNGHAAAPSARVWDASLQRIERRLTELAAAGDQRTTALRDAIGEFIGSELATRDGEIAALRKHISGLENQLAQRTMVDRQVADIAAKIEERQARRDEGKRGGRGPQGEPGRRGAQGATGPRGPVGPPGLAAATIIGWKIDAEGYRAVPFFSDGSPGPELNLRPLFERFVAETSGGS